MWKFMVGSGHRLQYKIATKQSIYFNIFFRMEFLAEHATTAMAEMKLNAETFRWMERMPPILEEHLDIISRSRREAEEGLKVCC